MSTLYPTAKTAMLTNGGINFVSDNIKAALIDTGTYTYSDSHQFWSSVPGGSVVGTPLALQNKTVTAGVFDADDVLYGSLTGASIEAVILYKDTGTAATSPLLAYLDGISILPQGNDLVVVWDQGPFKIFSL